MKMAENVIGPTLPSCGDSIIKKKKNAKNNDNVGKVDGSNIHIHSSLTTSQSGDNGIIGPAIPPNLIKRDVSEDTVCIGPSLPPHLIKSKQTSSLFSKSNQEEDDSSYIGPALPPHMLPNRPNNNVGPPLPVPPHMTCQKEPKDTGSDFTIGPLPPSASEVLDNKALIAKQIEDRAKSMKDKLTGKTVEKVEREEWMTELPPVLQGFGMGPRKFRNNPINVGDRSVWTDTPADKLRKAKERKSEVQHNEPKVKKQKVESNSQQNVESLLSSHQKKRKQQIKETSESEENVRRPFDREIDLGVNRFDNAAKKRAIKQSQELSTRFSHGETSSRFL